MNSVLKKRKPARASSPAETRQLKRLNFKLPERIAGDLTRLAEETGLSMTELVRQAIELRILAWDAKQKNASLGIIDDGGKAKEIYIL